ncbi:hypothetical protein KVL15_01695 [Helicobacter pylori]|nr:hypothetical protein KVL15_04425 [Helicobacter pylori]WQX35666.1 hypothetical protein KVL15_01695 [Helicobacter pylori]
MQNLFLVFLVSEKLDANLRFLKSASLGGFSGVKRGIVIPKYFLSF